MSSLLLALLACDPAPDAVEPPESSGRPGDVAGDDSAGDDSAGDTAHGTSPVACPAGWTITPDPPGTSDLLEIRYTDDATGWAWIELWLSGPGAADVSDVSVESGSPPYAWRWSAAVDTAGVWALTITADEGATTVSACEIEIAATGDPPDLPAGACDDRVCGEDDGDGGVCTACLMEESEGGDCLDPPSPITPDGEGEWSCLDAASCEDNGTCRIWCPGEPCDTTLHPDGCPQGVEACWVDPGFTSYEDACRSCCESRHHAPTGEYACWDSAYNLCRYPGDCGNPYPQ